MPVTVSVNQQPSQQVEDQILGDLLNCLMAEGYLNGDRVELLSYQQGSALIHSELAGLEAREQGSWHYLRWRFGEGHRRFLLFAVAEAIVQPYRYLPGTGVYVANADTDGFTRLNPVEVMDVIVGQCLSASERQMPGVSGFMQLLAVTQWQTLLAYGAAERQDALPGSDGSAFFQAMECRAALRDRPFHPVAKAKMGLTDKQCAQYLAEFTPSFKLGWVAVDDSALMTGERCGEADPASYLLTAREQLILQQAMQARGLPPHFLALPVHPWQLQSVLPEKLPEPIAEGTVVPLDCRLGEYQPTSSVRSLSPKDGGLHYLKLPLGVFSLGACRYLPAVKMINGDRGEQLLRQALERDAVLQQRLHLCDESQWWAYLEPGGSLFDDPPRHLSAMVRRYPSALIDDAAIRLVPMSALGATPPGSRYHFFDDWIQARQLPREESAVMTLFGELCELFFELLLRLYRLGLLPEIHGQNSVLVWRNGHLEGLLLRDHDSVRLHLPWLVAQGIEDPGYRIRPGYSNSLYNETPGELLHYLQSLGIQVNLYAVIETLGQHYGIAERRLWRVLSRALEQALDKVAFAPAVWGAIYRQLFTAEQWPLKCLVKPLLFQKGVPGAMPASWGQVQNPLLVVKNDH